MFYKLSTHFVDIRLLNSCIQYPGKPPSPLREGLLVSVLEREEWRTGTVDKVVALWLLSSAKNDLLCAIFNHHDAPTPQEWHDGLVYVYFWLFWRGERASYFSHYKQLHIRSLHFHHWQGTIRIVFEKTLKPEKYFFGCDILVLSNQKIHWLTNFA